MGHQVVFFAMQDTKNEPCEQQKYFLKPSKKDGNIVEKIRMIKNMNYSKEAYKSITNLIKNEKPDIAILNLVHKQITVSIIPALKKFKIKIVWTMHDLITVCPSYTMIDGKGKICEKCLHGDFSNCIKNKCIHNSLLMSFLSMREAKYIKKGHFYDDVDIFVCPSKFYKQKLIDANFTSSKIEYFANPLPLDTEYNVTTNPENYFLYFGRLSHEKGLFLLIDALKATNHKLIILGTGPLENELFKYINDRNLNDRVHMLGFKTGKELKRYVANAKCVVIPSQWYENGPYAAMEAMALGRPLIVSNYGGLPELVDNNISGYIFDNLNDLVLDMNKIMAMSKTDYQIMCDNSVLKAKTLFEPTNYIDSLIRTVTK